MTLLFRVSNALMKFHCKRSLSIDGGYEYVELEQPGSPNLECWTNKCLYKSVQDGDGIEVVVSRMNRFVFHFHPQQHFLKLAREEEDVEEQVSLECTLGWICIFVAYIMSLCLCVSLYLHLELIAMLNTVTSSCDLS